MLATAALRSAGLAAPTGGALRDALTASLNDHGLTPTQVQVIGNAIQITLKNASFPEWTVWLDDARRQLKVQVVDRANKTLAELDCGILDNPDIAMLLGITGSLSPRADDKARNE